MISAHHSRDGSHGLLAHWQWSRLVGECNVGLVQVGISCESQKMLVFDMQDAPGLTIESAVTFFSLWRHHGGNLTLKSPFSDKWTGVT
jgi:hypothetical protein